ncbi:hypothetical protein FEDK69T_04690 [Flavobacterium enshiense DK69]|nr:hypothetical protein FEDK69T_04690 [Flavobacterium enshiense DK69]
MIERIIKSFRLKIPIKLSSVSIVSIIAEVYLFFLVSA